MSAKDAGPPAINVDDVVAIDVHTHVMASVNGGDRRHTRSQEAVAEVFSSDSSLNLPQLASHYRERKLACVAFMVDKRGVDPVVTNEEILTLAQDHRDVVIPFASVDPARPDAPNIARALLERYAVSGFKFHPSFQEFFPNDPAAYPLYEVLQEHRIPALFHTGQTAVGSGQRGGGGIRIKFSNPEYLDDVAVDFPDMPIVMAHPSVPWQDTALSIALHKPQVYIDLSGWAPKYFPPQLVRYANSLLKEKVLFGTDWPALTPERWIREFEQLDLKPEVRLLILKENAARLFALRHSG